MDYQNRLELVFGELAAPHLARRILLKPGDLIDTQVVTLKLIMLNVDQQGEYSGN